MSHLETGVRHAGARSRPGGPDTRVPPPVAVLGTRGFPDVQGGVERHCEELLPRLAAMGVPLLVFSRSPYVPAAPPEQAWRGVTLRKLWAPRKKFAEAILHSALAVVAGRLARRQVAHIHSIGPGLVAPLARALGMRVVFTHHGFDYDRDKWGGLSKAALRAGEWCAATFAHEVLAVSRDIQTRVATRFAREVRFAPNGVELPPGLDAEAAARAHGLARDGYVVQVARLVPEKGWHVLFAALEALGGRLPFVGVGGADHASPYATELLAAPPTGGRMLGQQPHLTTLSLVQGARVFVLPSSHEGLPIALLEALACGTIAVASDIAPHREVIRHGVNGFLFRTGDAADLARVLEAAWALDGAARASMQEAARRTVRDAYTWDHAVRAVLAAYCG